MSDHSPRRWDPRQHLSSGGQLGRLHRRTASRGVPYEGYLPPLWASARDRLRSKSCQGQGPQLDVDWPVVTCLSVVGEVLAVLSALSTLSAILLQLQCQAMPTCDAR